MQGLTTRYASKLCTCELNIKTDTPIMADNEEQQYDVPKKTLVILKKVTSLHNPFDIIGALPEESNQEIRKKYRKVR